MHRLLLILLLFTCTSFTQRELSDTMLGAAQVIPQDTLVYYTELADGEKEISYKYDKSKILHVDFAKQKLSLYSADKRPVAVGRYKTTSSVPPLKLYADGEWTEYYDNGTPRKEYHYKTGPDKKSYLSGEYKEYHPNGVQAVTGSYIIAAYAWADSTIVIDPVTGKERITTEVNLRYHSIPNGNWSYYNTDGKPASRKEFD